MIILKILVSLVVLAGSGIRNTHGVYISRGCLLQICTGKGPNRTVDAVHAVNHLLSLRALDEDAFYCSRFDVMKYRGLIACECPKNETCRITRVDFSNMGLKGRLPQDDLGYLTHLTNLDLGGNRLYGAIPNALANLVNITYVNLCNNDLDGPIPPFNGRNPKLRILYLCKNRLNGTIPEEFGELQSLANLYLFQNHLAGPIPREFWKARNLARLRLQDNQLNGSIPAEMGALKNLEEILLMNNNFSGELPDFTKLSRMKNLKIQGNNFNGFMPKGLNQLSKLQTLWLIGNDFKGPLPAKFSSNFLTDIALSDVSGRSRGIFGTKQSNLFPDVGQLVNLTSLTLRNCSLSGGIPPEIWSLPNLIYLDLSFNELSGQLPPNLTQKLKTVYLRRNNFSESLPEWVNSNDTKLYVDLSDNLFKDSGVIKLGAVIANNTNLVACCSSDLTHDAKNWLDFDYGCAKDAPTHDYLYINCGGKAEIINGSNYQADVDPNGGSSFVLSQDSTWGYSSMGKSLYPRNDRYIANETCNISMADAPLYTSARTAPISLKYYGFCLKNDEYIVRLHFAEIGWGANPMFVVGKRVFNVDIQGKKELDAFNIESEAKGIYKSLTREFRATVNNSRLEIHFYWSGKGSMFVPQQYGPLISAISVSAVPKKQHKISTPIIGSIVGSSMISVALLLAVLWMLGFLGGKKPNKNGVELYPGGFYKFEQIRDATNNFSSENQIGGSGKVYKGILKDVRAQHKDEIDANIPDENVSLHKDEAEGKPKDEIVIAVKKLSAKTKELQEIGLVSNLEHPNIAKPMGCCTKDRQVLIIYKYMENVSLQYALFGDEVKSQLNWQTRCKIILGIAKGLIFLHAESQLGTIIHSNIKPTNILLDKDFNVKISDFGYFELHDDGITEQGALNTPRAKDTGHMAPEYMQGRRLTPKSDVYSFGLVLLEIISGQPHIIVKTKEDIHLINTAYTCYEDNKLEALIDDNLSRHADYKHNEAINMLHLAMKCVSPGFDLRPTMFEVVQMLDGKKKLNKKQIHTMATVEPI